MILLEAISRGLSFIIEDDTPSYRGLEDDR